MLVLLTGLLQGQKAIKNTYQYFIIIFSHQILKSQLRILLVPVPVLSILSYNIIPVYYDTAQTQ